MLKRVLYFNFILWGCIPTLLKGGYTFAPVRIDLSKDKKIASLQVKNNNNAPSRFQVTLLKKAQKSQDLLLIPRIIHIPAGKSQTIRVALRNNVHYSNKKNAYEISIKELPNETQRKSGSRVRIVTDFRIPVNLSGFPDVGTHTQAKS